jgi:hypothetical protein
MQLPATARRVEYSTEAQLNEHIRARTDAEVVRLESASDEEISQRLRELVGEWDVERLLQVNASVLVMLGVLLGAKGGPSLPGAARGRVHLLRPARAAGWCPPLPLFRRTGVRTQREIARERYALKAMRGDLDGLPAKEAGAAKRVRAALAAVDK